MSAIMCGSASSSRTSRMISCTSAVDSRRMSRRSKLLSIGSLSWLHHLISHRHRFHAWMLTWLLHLVGHHRRIWWCLIRCGCRHLHIWRCLPGLAWWHRLIWRCGPCRTHCRVDELLHQLLVGEDVGHDRLPDILLCLLPEHGIAVGDL